MTNEVKCAECDAVFSHQQALKGHISGAHRRKLKPIAHGTNWGYQQHLRRGIVPCDECKTAHAVHNKKHYNKDYYDQRAKALKGG